MGAGVELCITSAGGISLYAKGPGQEVEGQLAVRLGVLDLLALGRQLQGVVVPLVLELQREREVPRPGVRPPGRDEHHSSKKMGQITPYRETT